MTEKETKLNKGGYSSKHMAAYWYWPNIRYNEQKKLRK